MIDSRTGGTQSQATIPADIRERLEETLLSLGGKEVWWQPCDPHAGLVLSRGEVFSQPVKKRRGEPNRCHANSADLWAKDPAKYRLATGYALSGHLWVSHSWVLDDARLYETSVRRDLYFGAVLPPFVALKFWVENFIDHSSPVPGQFIRSLKKRPGLQSLFEQISQLSRDEVAKLVVS